MNADLDKRQIATLAGGCFWCLEAVFEQVRGIEQVVSGYTGGNQPNPTYEAVCSGRTGHAEAVQITYDPAAISFTDLLEVFFSIHDPTTLNRQGNDVGTQYRSAIFYHSESQHSEAQAMIASLDAKHLWPAPIVTELVAAPVFYPAEGYHQHYYARNPNQAYCQFVIAPKLAKFGRLFAARQKNQ
jgi:peptide-methionine (S)-S-oxide reductase